MPDTTFTIHGKNLTKEAIAQLKADIEKTTKALHEQAGASVEVEQTTKKTATSYTGLAVVLGGVSASLGLLTRSIVGAAMQQERMMLSLNAVEGGAKNAEKAMIRLREVAKLPGLNLQQAVQGYTNLRAIDMNAQLAERSLKAFGNALVTVGKGAPELQLVILALTQMSAKGKVLGQDLRQLQEQLPQIRKVMKDAFGTADVEAVQKKLEETGQTADDFIKTIVSGFEKLPQVVGGTANAVENFKDQWFQTKVLLGEALLPILTKVLDLLGDLMNVFNQLPKPIKDVIGMGIAGGAGLAGIGFTLAGIAKVIPTIKSGLSFLPKAFSIFSTGALASLGPIAIMLAEILGTVYALRKALTEPIDIKAIDKATDKATLGKLNKAKAVVEKQMTRAEYKSGDYTNTETRYGVSDLYPNLDPMITAEDLLERINNQIDMIQNKTAGKGSVVQAIYGDPKEIKTVFDFEEIKKQLDDLMNISSTGYGMSKGQQVSWLSDWLARPQALTEDAKIGIRNTIKDLQSEIDKELRKALEKNNKLSISDFVTPTEKITPMPPQTHRAGPFAYDEGLSLYDQLSANYKTFGSLEDQLKSYASVLPIVADATRYLREEQSKLYISDLELQDSLEKNMRLQDERQQQLVEQAKEYGPEGIPLDEIAEAFKVKAEWEQKAYDDAIKRAKEQRDQQMEMWEGLASDIANVFGRIPQDLIQNFDDIGQVFKNFAMGLLNSIASMVSQIIQQKIFGQLMEAFNMAVPAGGGGLDWGSLLKMGLGALSIGSGVGILPTATAGVAGTAEALSLFFDDPKNDMLAYKSGERSAITMTMRSSEDFINNFEKGFTNSNQSASGEGGLGGKLDKLIGLMENTKYEFYLDSDPIVSTVRKQTNKKLDRGEWAK